VCGAAIAQLPDDLLSRNTLKNIEKNKERTDYCVTTFKYISNRYLLSVPLVRVGATDKAAGGGCRARSGP
jgi:hypothetical protein